MLILDAIEEAKESRRLVMETYIFVIDYRGDATDHFVALAGKEVLDSGVLMKWMTAWVEETSEVEQEGRDPDRICAIHAPREFDEELKIPPIPHWRDLYAILHGTSQRAEELDSSTLHSRPLFHSLGKEIQDIIDLLIRMRRHHGDAQTA